MSIALNADLGESWYNNEIGNDAGMMPFLDTCNIACGFHGGDAVTMQRTIALALDHGVEIGAHPSYPDRRHFGRVKMRMKADRLYPSVLYQVAALQGMVEAAGGRVNHIKPHGALYHYADSTLLCARIMADIARKLGIPVLYGPPGGMMARAAAEKQLIFHAEGFADRRYEPSLHLRSRYKEDSTIGEAEEVVEQVRLLAGGRVRATDGQLYPLAVDTICIHGDHTGSVERARLCREILDAIPPR